MTSDQVITVTPRLMASVIRGLSGSTIATVFAETIPRMKRRGNPWFDRATKTWFIRKLCQFKCVLGGSYQSAVNKQRRREWDRIGLSGDAPEFHSQGRLWGRRMRRHEQQFGRPRSSIVEHRGRFFLDIQRITVLQIRYVNLQGHEISELAVRPWLTEHKSQSTRQGTEKQVTWRDYGIETIQQVRMHGRIYQVMPATSSAQQQQEAA